VLLWIYMFLTTIMLVNLLIAQVRPYPEPEPEPEP